MILVTRIRLINTNLVPNVSFNGTAFGKILYVEGRGPAALLTAVVIRDGDHTHLME